MRPKGGKYKIRGKRLKKGGRVFRPRMPEMSELGDTSTPSNGDGNLEFLSKRLANLEMRRPNSSKSKGGKTNYIKF